MKWIAREKGPFGFLMDGLNYYEIDDASPGAVDGQNGFHVSGWMLPEHARLIAAAPQLADFVRDLANMVASGELVEDGEPFRHDPEDAAAILDNIIRLAREAIVEAQ